MGFRTQKIRRKSAHIKQPMADFQEEKKTIILYPGQEFKEKE